MPLYCKYISLILKFVFTRFIAQDTEGNVCCLDLRGNEVWTVKLRLAGPNNSSSSIAVIKDRIFCGGQQEVYCLNAFDGSILWSRTLSGGNTAPTGFVLYENRLFVGAQWDRLYALEIGRAHV